MAYKGKRVSRRQRRRRTRNRKLEETHRIRGQSAIKTETSKKVKVHMKFIEFERNGVYVRARKERKKKTHWRMSDLCFARVL